MTRTFLTSLVLAHVLAAGLGLATAASAQGTAPEGRKIPIERDLRTLERNDRRLGIDPNRTAEPNVTPANPSGVAGFNGPPGIYGDSVGNVGPLPPGAAGNDQ